MSILRTTGLVAGHYECRSLSETLPVFTDLLAMEIVEQKAGEATLKHPNIDWCVIVHEGGPKPKRTSGRKSPASRRSSCIEEGLR